jgi:hypothetical protein
MVRQGAKVPEVLLTVLVGFLWACGGEARSEEGPEQGEAASSALVESGAEPAPAPGTRAAAAIAAVRGGGEPPTTAPTPTLEQRVREAEPVEAVAEPVAETPVMEVDIEPLASPTRDNPAPPSEDEPAVEEPVAAVESTPDADVPVHTQPTPEPPTVVVAKGVELTVVLETGLSTRQNVAGDPFFAHVTDDVLDQAGMVLIPLGARVRGRVVESRKSTGPDRPAVLELAMEALIENGRSHALVARVVRTELKAETGESTARSAAKIGVGAAAGAVIGKLLGKNTEAAVAGAIAGAAAGTAAAMSAKDGHAEIPEGSTMVIRLDVPIELDPR